MAHRILILLILGCALTASAAAQQPDEKPVPARPKFIKGRVLGDDGQPLASVPIFLVSMGRNAQNMAGRFGGLPGQITTDEEGNFAFDNVSPGSYAISASVPGYIAQPPDEESGTGIFHPGEFANITMVKGGVITGKITNAKGEPVIGAAVNAIRVGVIDGEADAFSMTQGFGRNWRSDDLGVYRIYGLIPGSYIVQGGGRPQGGPPIPSQFSDEAPTFYPSSPRDAAVPVALRQSEEVLGIDIRLRGEKGRIVSGKVLAKSLPGADRLAGAQISLYAAGSDVAVATTFQINRMATPGFVFYGIPDGEYEIVARENSSLNSESDSVSAPRHISVRGADVGGVELSTQPLALLSGRVTIERNKSLACLAPRNSFVEETLFNVEAETTSEQKTSRIPARFTAPLPNGDLVLRNLEAGRHRLDFTLPDENWFVRAIQLDNKPLAAAARKGPAPPPINVARAGLILKAGEKLSGLTVSIAEGAAGLKGKIIDGQNHVVHLLPAEKESSEDLLRYSQSRPGADGEFHFKNLAPGRYFLLAKLLTNAPRERSILGNQSFRASLRNEALAAGSLIELSPCQRIIDIKLRSSLKNE